MAQRVYIFIVSELGLKCINVCLIVGHEDDDDDDDQMIMMMMGKKENKSKDGPDMKSLPALNSFEKASIKYKTLMAFVQTGREEGI